MAGEVEDALIVRMEASLRKFERQMEAGRKAAEKAAVGAERAWQRGGDRIAANANRAATGLERITNVSGRGRFVIQNTANQIGDMAVQIGGGTSAMKAMGQQLPQMLGGFGALGGALGLVGPLLGTVAALGIPVAAALLSASDEGRSLSDIMGDLNKALGDMDSAAKIGMMSMSDLTDQYGENAAAIREVYLELVAVNQQRALNSVQDSIAAAGDELSGLETQLRDFADARRELLSARDANSDNFAEFLPSEIAAMESKVSASLQKLQEDFGLTSAQAYRIVEALEAMRNADGPEAAADAVRQISLALSQAAKEGAQLDGVFANIAQTAAMAYAAFSQAITQGRKAAAELANTTTGTPLFRQGISGSELLPPSAPASEPSRRTRRGGGGGARIDPGLREAEQLFERTRTSAEKYAAELERIEELHRRFPQVVTSEVRDRAIAALNETANAAEGVGKRIESSFESAFTALVTGAGSGREVVQSLLADLARLAAQSAFKSLVGGGFLGNFFGGLFANAKGNAFQGGRVTPFANGGVVSSPTMFPMRGGTGLMGEAGPEAIMPLTRTANGKLGVQSQGGGGNMDVRVYVDENGNWQAAVERISGNVVARAAPVIMGAQDRKTASNLKNFTSRQG